MRKRTRQVCELQILKRRELPEALDLVFSETASRSFCDCSVAGLKLSFNILSVVTAVVHSPLTVVFRSVQNLIE
jgi:hypothetical protein